MADKTEIQGDFLRLIPTQESGMEVNLSFTDTYAGKEDRTFLLRIGPEDSTYACAYLDEAQLGLLVKELQAAQAAFDGKAVGVNDPDVVDMYPEPAHMGDNDPYRDEEG